MNTTNTKTNETSAKNAANINTIVTPITSVPYRATLHPTLRSLWNIPHVIQIPDPMPAPPHVLQLLREHLTRHQTQLAALTPTDDAQIASIADHKFDISVLQNKIEELLTAFPDLGEEFPEGTATRSASAASVHKTSDNPPAPSVSTSQNKNSPAQSGQNPQPLPAPSDPEWPESGQHWPDHGQHWPDHGQDLPDPCQHGPEDCQTRPNPGQPTQSTEFADPSPSPNSETDQPKIQSEKAEQPCCQPDDDPDLDGDDDDDAEEDDLDPEEADFAAELAGYANDAERMAEAAADFQAHRKKRSRFDTLSAEDQAAIIVMLDIHDSRTVARTLAKPQPIGMNFKISKSGLNNWARSYRNRQAELRLRQNVQAAADLIDKSPDPDKAFQQTLERLLRIRTLTIAGEPNAPLAAIDALITTINKLRKQTLAERKQTHAELNSV